jgi:hypothetical protein
MGVVAAINEMLLHSHIPRQISLLPALPISLGVAGHAYGLRARGDVGVSMHWRDGKVLAAAIVFNSPHPWLNGLKDMTWSEAMQREREKRVRKAFGAEEGTSGEGEGRGKGQGIGGEGGGRRVEESSSSSPSLCREGAAMRGFYTAAEQPFPDPSTPRMKILSANLLVAATDRHSTACFSVAASPDAFATATDRGEEKGKRLPHALTVQILVSCFHI